MSAILKDPFDATPFLSRLSLGRDVVVKRNSALPFASRGSDVDIFSLGAQSLLADLAQVAGKFESSTFKVRSLGPSHHQADLMDSAGLVIKFDIYSEVPSYNRFRVDNALFVRAIARSVRSDGGDSSFPACDPFHEAIIRYLEYCEFFWTGPEKPHHLDWILSSLSSEEIGRLFETAHELVLPAALQQSDGGRRQRLEPAMTLWRIRKKLKVLLRWLDARAYRAYLALRKVLLRR